MWLMFRQMPMKAGWWGASVALWYFSYSSKHCIQLFATNTIYISHFVIAMSAFQKQSSRVVLKNFAKFIGVSSGTGASCEFCNILKNTFLRRTPPVAASGICTNRYFLFYGGAKDFIFTCIFLRIITLFIKI